MLSEEALASCSLEQLVGVLGWEQLLLLLTDDKSPMPGDETARLFPFVQDFPPADPKKTAIHQLQRRQF